MEQLGRLVAWPGSNSIDIAEHRTHGQSGRALAVFGGTGTCRKPKSLRGPGDETLDRSGIC